MKIGPTPSQHDIGRDVRARLIGMTYIVIKPAILDTNDDAKLDDLGEEMAEIECRVRGNRPGTSPITWDDEMAILETTMQYCLDMIRQHRDSK